MAQLTVHGNWKSVAAMTSLFIFVGLTAFAVAGGVEDKTRTERVNFGLTLYGIAILVIFFGFWSKEDAIAVTGILGISLLLMLDILLRIGVLSFNS